MWRMKSSWQRGGSIPTTDVQGCFVQIPPTRWTALLPSNPIHAISKSKARQWESLSHPVIATVRKLQHSKVSITTEKIESRYLQTPERWISKKSWIRCGLFLTKTNTYSCWPTYMLLIWLVPRRGIFQEGSWEGSWEGPKWMWNSKNSKGPSNFVAKASNLHQRLMTGRPLHLFYPIRTPPATSWRSYFENSNRYHRSWPRQKDLPALPRVAVEPRVQRWRLSTSTNRCEFLEAGRDWPIVLPTYSQISPSWIWRCGD